MKNHSKKNTANKKTNSAHASLKLILTCEHGGAEIPATYKKFFQKNTAVLKTHRALDIGALKVALKIQKILKAPLDYSKISRLVVDLNRTLTNPTLFSEFMASLTIAEKNKVLKKHYTPHWEKVLSRVYKLVSQKNHVLHIAVHSMTDQLHGKVRPMQLALLYNSRHKKEKQFASLWIRELRKEFPHFKMARNNPYNGHGDGLTTILRSSLGEKKYFGIELEMNQKLLQSFKNEQDHEMFSLGLARSLQKAVQLFTID